jgi:hypothetical protein
MAIQDIGQENYVNIGFSPNSQDGDKLRDAFIKVNSNTEILFAADNYLEDLINGLSNNKVDKVAGYGLSQYDFNSYYKTKLDNAESTVGAQEKANAALASANEYTDTTAVTIREEINLRALISETGYRLTSDQTNAVIHLRDKNDNILSSLSVGFLNNEGTTLVFNSDTREIELQDDSGTVLSSFPVADLLTKVGEKLVLTGDKLQLVDSTNTVLSEVSLQISNIQNLQAELDLKESIVNVDSKVATAEANAINWAKQYGLGTSLISKSAADANSLDKTGFFLLDSASINTPETNAQFYIINLNASSTHGFQIGINYLSGTSYTRVNNNSWSGWLEQESVVGSQAKADAALSSANAYTDSIASTKVDKVAGKGLSSEDFTSAYRTKLDNAESVSGAQSKADSALTSAKSYADTGDAHLQQQIDAMEVGDGFVNITGDETIWDVKTFVNNTVFQSDLIISGDIYKGGENILDPYETIVGAESKIATAKSEAIAYTDSIASTKVDKVAGKQLSTEDFTTAYRLKLDNAESVSGAQAKADTAEADANAYTDSIALNKQNKLTPDDGSITIDELNNIRVNVENWDLATQYEGQLNF